MAAMKMCTSLQLVLSVAARTSRTISPCHRKNANRLFMSSAFFVMNARIWARSVRDVRVLGPYRPYRARKPPGAASYNIELKLSLLAGHLAHATSVFVPHFNFIYWTSFSTFLP